MILHVYTRVSLNIKRWSDIDIDMLCIYIYKYKILFCRKRRFVSGIVCPDYTGSA